MDQALIEKYFNGQCTQSEAAKVLEWFQTSEGREYLENELDRDIAFFGEVGEHLNLPDPDSEAIFDQIRKDQFSSKVHQANRQSSKSHWKKVAAIFLVVGMLSVIVGIYASNWNTEKIVKTGNGEKEAFVLPDSSKIVLHSNSSLKYLSSFKKREVFLEGEAYFKVEHAPERPFVVYIEDSYVKVLGTEFVVSQYTGNGRVEVAVKSGKVELGSHKLDSATKELEASDLKEKTIEITDDEVGIKNKNSDPFITDSMKSDELFDWTKGMMIFRNTPMAHVIAELENRYGVKFVLEDPEIRKHKFTSSFNNQTLSEVLNVLTLSLDFTYRRVGNKIYISD